jgi:hypothetical protein
LGENISEANHTVPKEVKLEDFLVEKPSLPRYDPEELQLELEMRGSVEIIGKPSSYRLKGTAIYLRFFSIEASCPLSRLGSTPEAVLMRLRTNNIWRIVKAGSGYAVADVRSVLPTAEEFEIAKKLINVYTPAEVIIEGLGYRSVAEVRRLLLPRIMPLVVDEYPFHVVQLTPPESGKTYFGVWAMKVAGWFYTTSCPTPAGMFYDARSGVYGFAMIANGVIFDEVDKWNSNYVMQTGIITYLPTFLENGVVVRPTSRLHTLGVIEKLINTVWFGNSGGRYGEEKEVVEVIFSSWGDVHGALLDRMTVIHVERKQIRISDYVTNRVLPETLMYAVLHVTRRQSVDRSVLASRLQGRQRRHSYAIQVATTRLIGENDPETADEVVRKGWATVMDEYGFG